MCVRAEILNQTVILQNANWWNMVEESRTEGAESRGIWKDVREREGDRESDRER